MRIDHVVYATRDLDAAAARLEADHGLVAGGGGRHTGIGTENRIVPLGGGYLELIAVADPAEAERSRSARRSRSAILERGEGLIGWVVAVEDVVAEAERTGAELSAIERDGLRAQLAGVATAMAEPALPFFIERDPGIADPGAGGDAGGITWVEVSGDAAGCAPGSAAPELPVRVARGQPALLARRHRRARAALNDGYPRTRATARSACWPAARRKRERGCRPRSRDKLAAAIGRSCPTGRNRRPRRARGRSINRPSRRPARAARHPVAAAAGPLAVPRPRRHGHRLPGPSRSSPGDPEPQLALQHLVALGLRARRRAGARYAARPAGDSNSRRRRRWSGGREDPHAHAEVGDAHAVRGSILGIAGDPPTECRN